MNTIETTTTKFAIFRGTKVRKTIYQSEWWFSVVDVCGALTDSLDSGAYWRKLKQRLNQEGSEVVTFCHGLKLFITKTIELSTFYRQLAKHIEFNRFKYVFNYGEFAINGLPTIEDLSIVQN